MPGCCATVWLASAVIGAELATECHDHHDGLERADLVKAGVALFILLPVSRVALMFFLFLRERDPAYMAISALVLAILGAGFLAGL